MDQKISKSEAEILRILSAVVSIRVYQFHMKELTPPNPKPLDDIVQVYADTFIVNGVLVRVLNEHSYVVGAYPGEGKLVVRTSRGYLVDGKCLDFNGNKIK